MEVSSANIKQFRASNFMGWKYLILPFILCFSGIYLSVNSSNAWRWISSQLLLGIFFFQCFILLHETGHFSFFKSTNLNKIFGHFFGFLSFIPFYSWIDIHNLHHRWTGWRDKDPTTEGTVNPKFGKFSKTLVNICWAFFIPLFTIAYRLGNYWSPKKLEKHLPAQKLRRIYATQYLMLLLYAIIFTLFGNWILHHILLAYLLSLAISDLFILSQHSHIEIPLAGEETVKPIRYVDQVPYTRSIGLNKTLAKLFFFNFNLHELHHAFPGVPAYHLAKIESETPNYVPFNKYFMKAKKMSGMKFIFSTSKESL